MKLLVKVGDVLDEVVDVLICTANPALAMSGGVGGALLERGGMGIQTELSRHLAETGRRAVEAGTIVRTSPGRMPVKHILHVVGVNAFYESSVDLVTRALEEALMMAAALGAHSVATSAIATGYGPLTIDQFATALKLPAGRSYDPVEELRVVLRSEEQARAVRLAISGI